MAPSLSSLPYRNAYNASIATICATKKLPAFNPGAALVVAAAGPELIAVIVAVANESIDPDVELGVTVTTVVLEEVLFDETVLPNTPVPLDPNRLNSATVAPKSSPVAWQPLISRVTYCPDHTGDEKVKYDMLPTYSCTTSLVAAL